MGQHEAAKASVVIDHPRPSARARDLVRGAYDLHVHVRPDVVPRRITDLELARRFQDVGMAGFVIKSHYTMTAERAQLVREVSGIDTIGAVTLNWSVGGLNPVAVEVCARSGGRFVWLPTADSASQARSDSAGPTPGVPAGFAVVQDDLIARGIDRKPIEVLDHGGSLLPSVISVLQVVAHHELVLCTGHLSGQEIDKVVAAALALGVKQIVITHPDFPSQRLAVQQQMQLAKQGCLLERCFGTPYAGRVSWEAFIANIRACGAEHSLVSSDLGQPGNPPVEDGMALMADRLLQAGFSDGEIHTMAVINSRRLAGVGMVAR